MYQTGKGTSPWHTSLAVVFRAIFIAAVVSADLERISSYNFKGSSTI